MIKLICTGGLDDMVVTDKKKEELTELIYKDLQECMDTLAYKTSLEMPLYLLNN